MVEVKLTYNPFKLTSEILIDGNPLKADHWLVQKMKGKRLQEYIGTLPESLVKSENIRDFRVTFHGFPLDYEDVRDAFELATKNGIINKPSLSLEKTKSDESEAYKNVLQIFDYLRAPDSPIHDFQGEKLKKEFEDIKSSVFPVHVIATMSSGKSTLINALLGQKLMPASNEACTAITTEITDNDESCFGASVYDQSGQEIFSSKALTYDEMKKWNDSKDVTSVHVSGDIPFLTASETQLRLVDTPGPNNSRDPAHKETTYRNINNASNNLILYVLNYTQLGTNDDAMLVEYIAKQMREQGKMSRDRFLFVINKMDNVTSDDSVEGAIQNVKDYLAGFGIHDPQIFPCSAVTALGIRTFLKDIDPSKMTEDERDELPNDVEEAYQRVRKLNRTEALHLEKYSTLSPSEQSKLNQELQEAIDNKNRNKQALIHSGIVSIEMAIKAYVTKYAKSKKIKDLTDAFRKKLDEAYARYNAADEIASDEKKLKEFKGRKAAVEAKIKNGNDAKRFKAKIDAIDPIPALKKEMDSAKKDVMKSVNRFWGNVLDVKGKVTEEEAKKHLENFNKNAGDIVAQLSVDLGKIVNENVVKVCEKSVNEYSKMLAELDLSSKSSLSFSTEDLVQSKLDEIRKMAKEFQTGSSISDADKAALQNTVKEETVTETKYVNEQEKQIVQTGTKTEKKLTGSHKETKTRMVKNTKKQGFFGRLKFWQPNEVKEKYDEWYDDYEDVEVPVYEEKMVDVIHEKKVNKTVRMVKKAELQNNVVSRFNQRIDAGINGLLDDNKKTVEKLKSKFKKSFDEINGEIEKEYKKLDELTKKSNEVQRKIEENRGIKNWISDNIDELDKILTV